MGPSGARNVQAEALRLYHLGLATLKLSRIQILKENLELVLGQSAIDMKFVGTDRPGREGQVKKLKRKFLSRLYILYI